MNQAKPRRASPHGVRRAAAALLAAAATAPAIAEEATPSPIMLRAGASWHHDSNVFRLPDEVPGVPLPEGVGFDPKSDRILSAYFLARVDRTFGQQRVFAEATATAFRYDRFTDLDRDAIEYRAAWDWRLTPWIGGTIATQRTEALLGFEITQRRRPTVNVTLASSATLDAEFASGWHLLGGVVSTDRANEPGFLPQPDYRETAREAGVRYVTAAGSALAALRRRREGRYDNLFPDPGDLRSGRYTSDETELRLTWLPAERSTVTGRLARIDRRHEDASFRDFSGNAGELAWIWNITGRVDLTATAQRDIAPWFALLSASYRVDDTYTVMPAWHVTEKVKLRLFAFRTTTRYLGAVGPDDSQRRDVMQGAQVAAEWSPSRLWTVSTTLQRERRDSTDPLSRFDDVVGGVNVSFSLRDFK